MHKIIDYLSRTVSLFLAIDMVVMFSITLIKKFYMPNMNPIYGEICLFILTILSIIALSSIIAYVVITDLKHIRMTTTNTKGKLK